MEKVLTLGKSIITGRLHNAYISSIMLNNPNSLDWIFSHHIQLYCHLSDTNDIDLNFFSGDFFYGWIYNPFVDVNIIKLKYITRYNLKDFITNSINDNRYILLQNNEYFTDKIKIANVSPYYYIHGYDSNDKYYNYGMKGSAAIESNGILENIMHWSDEADIITFKLKPNVKSEINIDYICECIIEYLLSYNSHKHTQIYNDHCSDITFGIDIYDTLLTYINNIITNRVDIDIRPFFTLSEHKNMMIRRLTYIDKDFSLSILEKLNEIYTCCKIIVNMVLKYTKTNNINILLNICKRLNKISAEEKKVYRDILEILLKYKEV